MNNWNYQNLRKLVDQSRLLTREEIALMYGVTIRTMSGLLDKTAPRVLKRVEASNARAPQ